MKNGKLITWIASIVTTIIIALQSYNIHNDTVINEKLDGISEKIGDIKTSVALNEEKIKVVKEDGKDTKAMYGRLSGKYRKLEDDNARMKTEIERIKYIIDQTTDLILNGTSDGRTEI